MTIDTIISVASSNLFALLGLAGVGLLAFWTFDERRNPGSTIEGVGERADDFFGNLLGGFGSLTAVVLMILTTIGAGLVDIVGIVVDVAGGAPALLLTQLAGVLIGVLGLSGVVPVPVGAWLVGAALVTVLALAYRRKRTGSAL